MNCFTKNNRYCGAVKWVYPKGHAITRVIHYMSHYLIPVLGGCIGPPFYHIPLSYYEVNSGSYGKSVVFALYRVLYGMFVSFGTVFRTGALSVLSYGLVPIAESSSSLQPHYRTLRRHFYYSLLPYMTSTVNLGSYTLQT